MKKVIEVPFVAGLCDKPLSQVSEILEAQGVRQAIDCVDWPNEFPYKPITSFYIARDKECLYINYFVKGNYLRAVNSTDNSPVWEDSCVEFFVQIPGEKYYYNFEFICIGTALAARRPGGISVAGGRVCGRNAYVMMNAVMAQQREILPCLQRNVEGKRK